MLLRPMLLAVMALCALPAAGVQEDEDWGVPPTTALRQAPYTAPTPVAIPGARVIRTSELRQLLDRRPAPLLIDVASGDGHLTLRGALWLPGVGRGVNFVDRIQGVLAERLEALTGGDKARPLVFFCVSAQCWLSYNAGLRAVALGYREVYWYRGGVVAWRAAGLPLETVKPLPEVAPPR